RVKYPNPFLSFFEKHCFYIYIFYIVILADAFIQSDLHMCDLQCIHILQFTLMAHCTSGAIRGSVSCSRTLRQYNRTSNLLITKRLLYLLYHCRPCALKLCSSVVLHLQKLVHGEGEGGVVGTREDVGA